MAILWRRQVDGTTYEVRGAGKTRRLYTDGVFHSQYNPKQPVTGSIWDLLLIPAFFYPQDKIKRILVLGVGGGTVIKQFQHFLQAEEIIGVELNSQHLYVAKQFFGVSQNNVKLIQSDAKKWIETYKGKPFDLIIDDIFAEHDGEPVRAIEANRKWFRSLSTLLVEDGALVSNFVSAKELKQSAFFNNRDIRNKFQTAFKLTAPNYENAIGVFLKITASAQLLRKNLMQTPGLNPTLKSSRLRYNLHRL